ncbi:MULTISPECIES: 50S ribosomal protein L4 [Caloramator]|jgi:large subunit ribosomal protein L4|uniref:Large ribosomal subunit protein uL4 n=1 Tax=Caloramator australicus RC3 TaxID=857293 RepID=I7LGI8_9CLOT|nr:MULTISPECIES: 50S ribosomal protein L4 [Caloramator]MDO6353793.1 50S ribosomal protein L4 [Caloramator sp. CAR-1]WDU83364.1 50S ribosomal protein L4 [Caloramator sp. Dgby_cultured_2]CCJ33310.1 LSU ribosomal protein L4p (L1e) [Caloramator australicus RC3]
MPKVDLFNMNAEKVGEIELSDAVFGAPINKEAMHQVVVNILANRRQGTQSALTRAEVSGGGKKPWRQKGTGRARHGSIRSPQWRHGGIVFAPKPRDYSYTLPKKLKRVALKSALSSKVAENQIIVLDKLTLDAPKTKTIAEMLKKFNANKTLIVVKESDEVIYKSVRNIENAHVIPVNNLNVYDILKYDKFIVTQDAARLIEEVYA